MRECAIVSGGNSGIGLAITRRLVAAGVFCFVLARNEEKWRSLGDPALTSGAEFVRCDVSETASITAALETVFARGIRVRYLVNCAGINHREATIDYPEEQWERIQRVNLTAPFLLSRGVARHFLAHGGGSIVNIGSMATVIGIPHSVAYGAAKAGLVQMTKALAIEWAELGIRVNAVNPGWVATELAESVLQPGKFRSYLDNRIAAGRLTQPNEVADAVYFLLSEQAANITGQALNVDGGASAGEPGLTPSYETAHM